MFLMVSGKWFGMLTYLRSNLEAGIKKFSPAV
jgi:hypothetical protein